MSLITLKRKIKNDAPVDLAFEWFVEKDVCALASEQDYQTFIDQISADYPNATDIAIMGSGNWGYSLSPKKRFRPFGSHSDIDVAIISSTDFNDIWDEIRDYHRCNFYTQPQSARERLLRNGQNVYSGFVTPKWNPNKASKLRFEYEVNTNKYSSKLVGFKTVNMMFFKTLDEVLDYYIRGIRLAKVHV
ncbi:hypothetical protein AB4393_03725 [Vibrio splendidus]